MTSHNLLSPDDSLIVFCCPLIISMIGNISFAIMTSAIILENLYEPRKYSWSSDWLQGGRERGRRSSSGNVKNFPFGVHPASYPRVTMGLFAQS
jgi:hypothetical protein